MSPARTEGRSGRSALDLVDRLLPIGWLALSALLPMSGWATTLLSSWADQVRDLEALRAVIAEGRADAIADNVVAPGYVAAARTLHQVLGLAPDDALVALSRASFALAVAVSLLLVRTLVRRLGADAPSVSLTAQGVLVALVLVSGTWHWSDVPWNHFFAAFLAVSFYAVRLVPRAPRLPHVALGGALLALLAATRTFEFAAVVLAWVCGLAVLALISGRKELQLPHWRPAAAGVGAFVLTTALVNAATGKRGLYIQGYHELDAGDVLADTVYASPTFSPGLLPTKLVQLFVDPCFYSLCPLDDYVGGEGPWRMPLLLQLPALVLLPACLVAVGVMVFQTTRLRRDVTAPRREVRLLAEMTIVSVGIVLGYAASTLAGPSHLKFGLARDFVLPALLLGVVGVTLAMVGLWRLLSLRSTAKGQGRWSLGFVLAVVATVGVLVVSALVITARSTGLPRIEARHIGAVSYTATCRAEACEVDLAVTATSGAALAIPETSTLTFACGDGSRSRTVHVRSLGDMQLGAGCAEPRLVAAWPLVMGLPTDKRHLSFVGVANRVAD